MADGAWNKGFDARGGRGQQAVSETWLPMKRLTNSTQNIELEKQHNGIDADETNFYVSF